MKREWLRSDQTGSALGRYFSAARLLAGGMCFILLTSLYTVKDFASIAGEPCSERSQYGHQVWREDNGLPQNTVFCLLQSSDGYLWMGTQEGLVRFDGVKFDVFDRRNTPELRDNYVTALSESKDGSLWVGTRGGGLYSYRNGSFKHFGEPEGLKAVSIMALRETEDSTLWMATPARGLVGYHGGKFTEYSQKEGLSDYSVNAILPDREGGLWVGTGNGLDHFKDGKVFPSVFSSALHGKSIFRLYEDRDNTLWISVYNEGLYKYANGTVSHFTEKDGLSSNNISSLVMDPAGILWIGTTDNGLDRLCNGVIRPFRNAEDLSSKFIEALLIDREGSLWVGTDGGGLNRFNETKFHAFGKPEGTSGELMYGIIEDHSGAVWMATADGDLERLKDGVFTGYSHAMGIPGTITMGLYEDGQDNLWIGTNDGLCKFANGKFTSYPLRQGRFNTLVSSICGDGANGLWVGTRSGLFHKTGDTFTRYTVDDGLSSYTVNCLFRDSKGNLWVGTGGGLDRLTDGKFTQYSSKNALTDDIVLALYEDAEGSLWIATDGGGLNRLKDGKFSSVGSKKGLYDDNIFSILEDRSQNLWMTSNRGVFRIRKEDFENVASGNAERLACVVYGREDGMRSRECNGAFQPSACKTRDGLFLFPTVKGAVMIDPEHLKMNMNPPQVAIEAITVDNDRLDRSQPVTLSPGKSRYEFEYAGLSFVAPEFVTFKYKLDGFDSDWVDAGTRRSAYYTNLPPGSYTFRVMAKNSDGIWNTEGASYSFSLQPHYYQTSWFFGLCLVGFVFAGYGVHRTRLHHVRTKELELVVDERTKDLKNEKEKTERALLEVSSAQGKIKEQAALLDRAHDAIFVLNLDHMIQFWNKGAERLYGWSDTDIIGCDVNTLLYAEKSLLLDEAFAAVNEHGEWRGELQQQTKGKKQITVQSNWSLVKDDQGEPKSILIINTDITEKKIIETQFLRAQRMQSVGTLAGGIAHDLNNVLAPIMVSIEYLRTKPIEESALRALQIMEDSAKRGASIVKQVLTFSRGVEGERNVVQMRYIASELEKIVKDTFPRSIRIQTEVEKGLWDVHGDPTQLYQVLMNLCVNARDAMPDGGDLKISIDNSIIDQHYAQRHRDAHPGNYIIISVMDSGTGILESEIDNIFEPFFTTKEIGKGTGLGLSTALGIVKSHGGFINVYSEPSRGTKFDVYLPALGTNGNATVKVHKTMLPKGNGELVLVVDDERTVRESQKSMLELYGYRVLLATNGVEATEVVAKEKGNIRIVITDMMMPLMDGMTTIREIRKIDPAIKFVAMSGLMGDQKVTELSSIGKIRFLQKPFGTDKLINALHDILIEN